MSNRPKITVPYQSIDIIIELINITLLIGIWLIVIINYDQLSETIPTHFNAAGEADDFGNKTIVWSLPIIATFTFGLVFIINRFPHVHNFNINITKDNALKNYRLSTQIARFANLYSLILIGVITLHMVQMGINKPLNLLNSYFLAFSILTPLLGIAFAFYYQKKINQ